MGLLADVTLSRRLFAVKNTLSVASAPMECLISILYWGLRAVRGVDTLRSDISSRAATDRPQPRPARMGAADRLSRRPWLPCRSLHRSRYRPPLLLTAVYDCLPTRAGLERLHRFRLLVLDRAMLPLQPLLSIPHLRHPERAAACRVSLSMASGGRTLWELTRSQAVRILRTIDDARDKLAAMGIRAGQWRRSTRAWEW